MLFRSNAFMKFHCHEGFWTELNPTLPFHWFAFIHTNTEYKHVIVDEYVQTKFTQEGN